MITDFSSDELLWGWQHLGGLQVGGGINSTNALSYIDEGASHVIVTSVSLFDLLMEYMIRIHAINLIVFSTMDKCSSA